MYLFSLSVGYCTDGAKSNRIYFNSQSRNSCSPPPFAPFQIIVTANSFTLRFSLMIAQATLCFGMILSVSNICILYHITKKNFGLIHVYFLYTVFRATYWAVISKVTYRHTFLLLLLILNIIQYTL